MFQTMGEGERTKHEKEKEARSIFGKMFLAPPSSHLLNADLEMKNKLILYYRAFSLTLPFFFWITYPINKIKIKVIISFPNFFVLWTLATSS